MCEVFPRRKTWGDDNHHIVNKRRRRTLAILLVALLGIAAWLTFRSREPEYHGTSLTGWLRKMDAWYFSGDEGHLFLGEKEIEAQRGEIRIALLQMGSEVYPYLTCYLVSGRESSGLRKAIEWLNEKQKFVEIPLHREPLWAAYANEAFRLLGTNATPAIPELEKLLQDERTSADAADCLLAIGPAALPTFVLTLTNNSWRVRNLALGFIGEFGPAASDAIPLIVDFARNTNLQYAGTAIRVLSEVDTNCVRHLPLLESRLFDTNYPFDAAFALGRMGPSGIPLLAQALTNQAKQIRIGALAALQPEITEVSRSGVNTPADYSFQRLVCVFNLKCTTAAALMYQHQEARLLVPVLTRLVTSTNPDIQAMAAAQLAQQGLAGAAGLSFVAEDAGSPAQKVASAALRQLGVKVEGGAIIRGRQAEKRLAMVFTGHAFGEGGETILNELAKHEAKGSFFLTGSFLTNQNFQPLIQRMVKDGHYLGPHSDQHLLYCSWDAERRTLVSRQEFTTDLTRNLQALDQVGEMDQFSRRYQAAALPISVTSDEFPEPRRQPRIFLPPYEHYNRDVVLWTLNMGMTLINFTPGTRSNADYTGEADSNFVSSQAIFDSILKREREDPHGLNGFILLLHIGSGPGRTDKFHTRFGELLDTLAAKGYQFVRVDELLETKVEDDK